MTPFISMCVLSYNRLDFLKHSLRSMVATADEPLEIVVHDDGSRSDVTQYLSHLAFHGGISHLILNPHGHNEGQGIALNRMFNMAKGDIIVKADHDLIYQRGWSSAIRNTLEKNAARRPTEPRIGALGLFKYQHPPVAAEDMFLRDHGYWEEHKDFCGSLIAMPRDAWEEFGPWEERSTAFAEDNVLKLDIAARKHVWAVGLTPDDYVHNIGFGEGPSTVVVRGEDGELTSRDIKTGPRLVETIVE